MNLDAGEIPKAHPTKVIPLLPMHIRVGNRLKEIVWERFEGRGCPGKIEVAYYFNKGGNLCKQVLRVRYDN